MPDASGLQRPLVLSDHFAQKVPGGIDYLTLPLSEIDAALKNMPPETVGHLIEAVFIHYIEIPPEAQIALAAYELRFAPLQTPRMAHYPHACAEMLNLLLSSGYDNVALEVLQNPGIEQYPETVMAFLDGPGSHMKGWAHRKFGAEWQGMNKPAVRVVRHAVRQTADAAVFLPLAAE